jgi:predicted thioredoxin/glutaredoxin
MGAVTRITRRTRSMKEDITKIVVCTGRSCRTFGADRLLSYLKKKTGLSAGESGGKISIDTCPCTSYCGSSPNIFIDGKIMTNVDEKDIEAHIHEDIEMQTNDENEKDRLCCEPEARTGKIPNAEEVMDANNFLGDL